MSAETDPETDPRPIRHTEADTTSETRFGPRPVPQGHHRPQEPAQPRRVPPHGKVSPDGRHAWPQPSRGARWLTWGGTALTAAALTAGTVLAARQVIHALSDDRPGRTPAKPAPRMAAMPEAEREALRRRAEARERDDAEAAAELRARAKASRPRRRAPRPGLMQEIQSNTASLTSGVENLMQALTAGMTGFRAVAGQASGVMREFGDAAAMVQDILGRNRQAQPAAQPPSRDAPRPTDRHGAHMPDLRDDPLTHDPLDGPEPHSPQDHNPRMHRL